jgi:hypothetical protein
LGRVRRLVGGLAVIAGSVEAHGKAAIWRMCPTILQASSTQNGNALPSRPGKHQGSNIGSLIANE